MATWSRKTLKIFDKILHFWKNDHLRQNFQNCVPESFHCDTDRRVVFKFREIWPTENRWNRALLTLQKISPGSQAVATGRMAPNICQGQPPTMYSECSRFHPNRFIFSGVIGERVNTAKTRPKVNPIFDWSLATSRIMNTLFFVP